MDESLKYILAPSLLAADFSILGKQILQTKKMGAQYIHIDVMDGKFVPSISFGMPVISSIRPITDQFFDVHLMIEEPERYIKEFAECGADGITFHLEATKNPNEVIDAIHGHGKRAGISIKPATPVEDVYPFLDKVDLILVMSVEPGFGGQVFMKSAYDKIRKIRTYLNDHGLDKVILEVDGGIGKKNVKDVVCAGATAIVAGSAVFKKRSIKSNIKKFKKSFDAVAAEAIKQNGQL